jgi:hypothetical protein
MSSDYYFEEKIHGWILLLKDCKERISREVNLLVRSGTEPLAVERRLEAALILDKQKLKATIKKLE